MGTSALSGQPAWSRPGLYRLKVKNMKTQKQRATEMRDAVLPWLRLHGFTLKIAEGNVLAGHVGDFHIVHRTPFSNLTLQPQRRNIHEAILLQQHGGTNLPYGLDGWYARYKVMNVEWNDTGLIHLASFRGGRWEEALLSAIANAESGLPTVS